MQCNALRKWDFFLTPLSIVLLNPKISGVTFVYENSLTWGREMWKIELKKVVGNLLDKLRKLYVNETFN